jgi:hypothetical protein
MGKACDSYALGFMAPALSVVMRPQVFLPCRTLGQTTGRYGIGVDQGSAH